MYSAKDVAAIVGLAESRVRYWAQTGFVGPSERSGTRPMYSFRDLVGVRAAKELLDRGLSLKRVRAALEALRAQLPSVDRPLERLRVLSDGERLVVAAEGTSFEPLTGQLLLEFDVEALRREAEVKELVPAAASGGARREGPRADADSARAGGDGVERSTTAYQQFLAAVETDESAASDADKLAAWQAVLAADAGFAAAHTNVGAYLHRLGRLDEARGHFEKALALDPEQPEARYNFGNLLADAGDLDGAVAAWTRVAADCPEFADAHFNLGVAFASEGASVRARSHLESYLALDGDGEGSWVERARELLAELSP